MYHLHESRLSCPSRSRVTCQSSGLSIAVEVVVNICREYIWGAIVLVRSEGGLDGTIESD
jgi:hypothetical protein